VSQRRRRASHRRTGSDPPNEFAADPAICVPLRTLRKRLRTRARAKPCLVARTHTLTHRSTRFENDRRPLHGRVPVLAATTYNACDVSHVPRRLSERPHGQSPGWCDDLHAHALLHTFRRRPRTLAWAKPCLAGRPTMLVRTQCCETNTSRGRRAGMELPDYPVVATLPTPWDQDGPARPLPAGSFPRFVARYASRRVFFQIRISLVLGMFKARQGARRCGDIFFLGFPDRFDLVAVGVQEHDVGLAFAVAGDAGVVF
jgi:hypothetical protein